MRSTILTLVTNDPQELAGQGQPLNTYNRFDLNYLRVRLRLSDDSEDRLS